MADLKEVIAYGVLAAFAFMIAVAFAWTLNYRRLTKALKSQDRWESFDHSGWMDQQRFLWAGPQGSDDPVVQVLLRRYRCFGALYIATTLVLVGLMAAVLVPW
ncbi:MAG: hypothetical protein AAGF92_08785 [Myxococcota bacterium]